MITVAGICLALCRGGAPRRCSLCGLLSMGAGLKTAWAMGGMRLSGSGCRVEGWVAVLLAVVVDGGL